MAGEDFVRFWLQHPKYLSELPPNWTQGRSKGGRTKPERGILFEDAEMKGYARSGRKDFEGWWSVGKSKQAAVKNNKRSLSQGQSTLEDETNDVSVLPRYLLILVSVMHGIE